MPKPLTARERIKEYYKEFPGATNTEIMAGLNMPVATFFRAKRQINQEEISTFINVEFPLPEGILKKVLPPSEYSYTHLAAYLTKFRNDEVITGYNKTKKEVMLAVKKHFENSVALGTDLVWGLQERLAIYSIVSGNVDSFIRTEGTIKPPADYLKEKI